MLSYLYLSGLAETQASYIYEAQGGFGLSGSITLSLSDSNTLSFAWKVYRTETVEKTFSWAVGERPFSFYRVVGKCKPFRCPPVSNSQCDTDQKVTYVVNIYARNLAEVCQKLRDRFLNFPVQSIQKFSRPASSSDFTSDTNTSCNELIDVTPSLSFLPCADLLVDVNVTVSMGMSARAILQVLDYQAGGRLAVTGLADIRSISSYAGQSGTVLSGSAVVTAAGYAFAYEATGGLRLTGEAAQARSEWSWDASGSLLLNGYSLLTLKDWDWPASGALSLSGEAGVSVFAAFVATGGLTTGESSAFGPEDTLPFYFESSGSLVLSNITDALPGQYLLDGGGNLVLSGLSRWVSSAIQAENSGSLYFRGSSGNLLENGGSVTGMLGGSADVTWSPLYQSSGSLRFGGEADVQTSLKYAEGGLRFGGAAAVTSSDQGTKVFNLGGSFFVVTEAVQFAFENAATLNLVTTSVTTACCSSPLPQRLYLSHQLASSNYFSRFLQRNGLTFASPVELYYNFREVGWYNTLHLQGFASDFPTEEQWTIIFGFQCVNSNDVTALPILGTYWQFTMLVVLRSLNNVSIPQRVTRVVAGFDANLVCFNNKALSFTFDLNTQTGATVPGTVQTLGFVDDIGMFKSSTFLTKPQIRFKISELAVDIPQVVVGIGGAVSSARQVGVSISGNRPANLPVG